MIQVVVVACLWFGTPCEYPVELSAPVYTIDMSASLIAPHPESHENASYAPVVASGPSDTVYRGMGTDWEQWRPLVASVFPADQVDYAVCVIQYESGGNPNAYNTSTASGLFQVKAKYWSGFGDLFDPVVNVTAAFAIWSTYGWGLPGGWTPKPYC